MIEAYKSEFALNRAAGERALAQMSDEAINLVPNTDGNSAAMLVRHIGGNLVSRFTDFLTSDGEKPWRGRDEEFHERTYTRVEMMDWWERGWGILESTVDELSDGHLNQIVEIRAVEMTVDAALARALGHLAYHVGQIVLLARMSVAGEWDWITVPKTKDSD